MKNLFLSIIILVSAIGAHAQNSFVNAPSASSGVATNGEDAKLNLNNGTANVGIPLLTLSDVGNSLPITLSYQTGGVKVSQPSSEIGLGWNLNAGGMISREVKGYPDDLINKVVVSWGPDQKHSIGFLPLYSDCGDIDIDEWPLHDTEPDIYTYNILGYTGKFFFNKSMDIVQVNASDIKIECLFDPCEDEQIADWKITLPDATIIYFGGNTYFDSYYYEDDMEDPTELTFDYTRVAWHVKKIEFSNGRDFTFFYNKEIGNDYIIDGDNSLVQWPSKVIKKPKSAYKNIKKIVNQANILRTIKSDNYEVVFTHKTREDFWVNTFDSGPSRISEIELRTQDGYCLNKITFDQSYFESDNSGLEYPSGYVMENGIALNSLFDKKRLKLDKVRIKSCDSEEEYVYDLEYYEEEALPRRLSCSQDLWGFHNGVMDNASLIPKISFMSDCFQSLDITGFDQFKFADRSISESHSKAGSLQKITYPNGYFNELAYESNSILDIIHDFTLLEEEEASINYVNSTSPYSIEIENIKLGGDENKLEIFVENYLVSNYKLKIYTKPSSSSSYTLAESFSLSPTKDFSKVYYTDDLVSDLNLVIGEEYDIKIESDAQVTEEYDQNDEEIINLYQELYVKYFESELKAENTLVGGLRITSVATPHVSKYYDYERLSEKQEYSSTPENQYLNFEICKPCVSNFDDDDDTSSRTATDGTVTCSGVQKQYKSNVYIPCNVKTVKLKIQVISGQCDGNNTGALFRWSGLQDGSKAVFNTGTSPLTQEFVLYDAGNPSTSIQPGGFYNFVFEAFPSITPSYATASLDIKFEEGETILITPDGNISNGHLIDVPSYLSLYKSPSYSTWGAYVDDDCYYGNIFQINSSSTTTINSLNGGHIIYSSIKETVGNGNFGYTKYDFFEPQNFLNAITIPNKFNKIFPLFAYVPTVESIYLDPIVGLAKTVQVFNANGDLVVKTDSEYESSKKTYSFHRSRDLALCSSNNPGQEVTLTSNRFYELASFIVRIKNTRTEQDGITSITDYEYRSDMAHLLPITITTSNPKATGSIVQQNYYAHDVADDFPFKSDLIDMNAINIPLQSVTDNGFKGGSKNEFSIVAKDNQNDRLVIRPKRKYTAYFEGGYPKWKEVERIKSYQNQIFPQEVWSKFKPLNTTYVWEKDLLQSKTYGVRTTSYFYDDYRRMLKTTNPLGFDNEIEKYDGFNRVKKKKSEIDGGKFIEEEYTYEISKTEKDVITHTTTFPSGDYDIPQRIVKTEYDERGLVLFQSDDDYMQDGTLLFTFNQYNALGKLTLNFTNEGIITNTYSKDVRQRVETVKPKGTDALISYAYGSNDEGEVPNYEKGALMKASVTDENGITSHSYTNFRGNKVLTVDGMGYQTKYLYYPSDLLKEVIPPGSSANNTDLNYFYVYTKDFKLEKKTVPGRNEETTIYDPELELPLEVILHNGDKISYSYNSGYPDFMDSIKLNSTTIKTFTPYHSNYLTNWVEEEESRVLGTSDFLKTTYDYDDIGRTIFSRIEYLDGGLDEITYLYDDLDNLRETTLTHSGNDDYTTTHYYDYDKGLRVEKSRAKLPINGESKEITIHENYYDARDWLTEVKVNDGLHTNTYKYHNRGLLKKINSVESTSDPSDEDCEEGGTPPIIPGCEGPYQIDDVAVFYDCFQLATGVPTTVSVTVNTSIEYPDGSTQSVDSNTYAFGFNGGGQNETLDNPTTIENSVNNNSSGSISTWIFSIIQECIHASNNPQSSLQNSIVLENMMMQLGGDIPVDPDTPDDPFDPADPVDPDAGNSLFGMEIYYEEGNAELGAQGYKNGNISWIEWKAKGEMYQAYGYQYDNKYRLIGANYKVDDPGGCFGIPQGAYNTTYGYDERGNFTEITRQGVTGMDAEGEYEYGPIDDLKFNPYNGNQISSISESADTKKGYRSDGGSYNYTNGNLTSDPNITMVTYNHMDLPTFIKSDEGNITITYDADGNKLKQIENSADGISTKTVYMGQMEYVDDERSSLYHEGGRIMYNVDLLDEAGVGAQDYAEWSISDHLGNTRIRYIDKDGDGSITTNRFDEKANEVSGTYHYYPYGMVMEGNFYIQQGTEEKYQYNGIEHSAVLGTSVGLTTYRVHDAAIGGWWQVDPKGESAYNHSPYNSMFNNPVSMSDPEGDLPFLAVVGIGAAVGVFSNGLSNISQGQSFFAGAGKAALWGGIGGAASFGIGSIFGGTGSFGHELLRGGAHALSGGLQAELQGGSFGQGFLSGGISSGLGSALGGYGAGGQIYASGLGGGIGATMGGGNFIEGFGQGLTVGALNHALHSGANSLLTDPPSIKPGYFAAKRLELSAMEARIGAGLSGASFLSGYGKWGLNYGIRRYGIQTNFRSFKAYNLYRYRNWGSNRLIGLNGNRYVSGSKFLNTVKTVNRVAIWTSLLSSGYDIYNAFKYNDSRYAVRGVASGAASFVPGVGWGLSYKISKTPIEGIGVDPYGLRHIGICFVPGTKILMADGSEKNIEDVRVGEFVTSYDLEKNEVVKDQVLEITTKPKANLKIIMNLESDQQVEFSPSHPFWIVGKGWSVFDPNVGHPVGNEPLGEIEVGDSVLFYDKGTLVETRIISLKETEEIVKMYNLNNIDGSHTFFANKILVHNKR